jgi:cysteine desulfurase
MSRVIYMDYAATTPVDPRVAHRMSGCLLVEGNFGNPASRSHVYGWRAEEAVEEARGQVAALLNADPREIVWTSGATESDNLAIKGVAAGSRRRHLITSRIEHKAVIDTCRYLESQGFEVTWLNPGSDGRVSAEAVAEALRPDTLLVSLMHVNNETGVINDLAAIGAVCRSAGVLFHTDAAQSAGKVPIDVRTVPVDLISLSAHKMYGPKGMGALYVRRDPPLRLEPMIHGGGHERGMRSGTLATHQIVGMGEACAIFARGMEAENARITALRERLLGHLLQMPGTALHGHRDARVPGIINVGFSGVEGETLLLALDDLAVSTGSACSSTSVDPSHVLTGMGVPRALAHASIRFSLGRYSTEADVDHAGRRVAEVVTHLQARGIS